MFNVLKKSPLTLQTIDLCNTLPKYEEWMKVMFGVSDISEIKEYQFYQKGSLVDSVDYDSVTEIYPNLELTLSIGNESESTVYIELRNNGKETVWVEYSVTKEFVRVLVKG